MLDLAKLSTETRNPATMDLDRMDPMEIASAMNQEDVHAVASVSEVLPQVAQAIEWATEALQAGGRIIYMGAGTSGRLGVLDAVECPPTFGVSPDVVVGLIAARELGCKTVAIACNRGSQIGSVAELAIEPVPGPEVVTGSTRLKAGTVQKLVLNMISTGSMVRTGKVYQNLMVDVQQTNEKLVTRAQNIVMAATECTRDEAIEALDQADGHVKTAVVMILAGLDARRAREALERSQGHVREAIAPRG